MCDKCANAPGASLNCLHIIRNESDLGHANTRESIANAFSRAPANVTGVRSSVHLAMPCLPRDSGRLDPLVLNLRHAARSESWDGLAAAVAMPVASARDEPVEKRAATVAEFLQASMSGSGASANYRPGCDARCPRGPCRHCWDAPEQAWSPDWDQGAAQVSRVLAREAWTNGDGFRRFPADYRGSRRDARRAWAVGFLNVLAPVG